MNEKINPPVCEKHPKVLSIHNDQRTANYLWLNNRKDIKVVIHGHTHRPGIEKNDDGFTRITLGPWEHCGWVCYQDESGFQLQCFNLRDRYET